MVKPVRERVQKYRDILRKAGLRPIQIWVPDTRKPGFEEACHAQAKLVAKADAADKKLLDFMDNIRADTDDWAA